MSCMCLYVCVRSCVYVCMRIYVCVCMCGLGKDRCLCSESTAPTPVPASLPAPRTSQDHQCLWYFPEAFLLWGLLALGVGRGHGVSRPPSKRWVRTTLWTLGHVSGISGALGQERGSVTQEVPSGVDSRLGSSALIWSVSHVFLVTCVLAWLPRSDSKKLEYFFKQPPKLNVSSFEDACFRNSLIFRGKKT